MKTYWKFGALVVVIVGTLGWLAVGGISESKTYYKTVSELHQMGDRAYGQRVRVGGDVEPGSIIRKGKEVHFTLKQDGQTLKCVYTGTEPLPDTFRDNAQALADGKFGPDRVFVASQIQAKCASKYEAKPGAKHPDQVRKAAL
jgi:cytochrome c-type biogenesis protein CcmE